MAKAEGTSHKQSGLKVLSKLSGCRDEKGTIEATGNAMSLQVYPLPQCQSQQSEGGPPGNSKAPDRLPSIVLISQAMQLPHIT